MKKKLLSGLFWVLLLNILIKPFWILGIEVGVQNAVGAEAYGFYFAIFNLSYIFNILLDLGITNFNTRNIAQHPQLITKHLSGILSIKVLLLGLYSIITFSVGLLMGYDSQQFYLLSWLCVNQFLNSLIIYLRSNFEGLLLFKTDSVLSILDRVLMIVICGCLLWLPRTGNFQIMWFVYAQTVAYAITAAIALVALFRQTGFKGIRWNRPFALSVLRQSAPFALLVLLMASYNRIDPVLIERLLPDHVGSYEAGLYAGAFRLLDALTMIAYLVSIPLLPIYAKLTAQKQGPERTKEIADTTRIVFSIMMVFAVTSAVTLSFLSQPLMDLFYKEHTEESARIFRVLIYGIVPISFTYIFGTLLTANGSLKQLNILAATALIVNVVANIFLIPHLAAYGSAWASLSAQSFMAVTQLVLALVIFSIRPSYGYVLRLGAFVVIVFVTNCLVETVSPLMHLIICGVVAVVSAFLLKLINVKELLQILRSEEE